MNQLASVPNRLVVAARELFPRHGYDGTSVRAITTRARANLGAVTYHFGSKEALYHAAIEAMTEPLRQRVEAATARALQPLDRIEAITRALLEYVTVNPEAPSILLRELASGRALPPPVERVMRGNLGGIIEAIKSGQKDGSIRSGDPSLLALTCAAQPFYVAIAGRILQDILGLDRRDPATRARIIDHVVRIVRVALINPPKAQP